MRYHMTDRGDLLGIFCRGQDAAVTGLCTLREFYLDHLYALEAGLLSKEVRIKVAEFIATAEVPRPDLPYQIAAVLQVVWADPALAGILSKTTELCAFVHSQHSIFTQ